MVRFPFKIIRIHLFACLLFYSCSPFNTDNIIRDWNNSISGRYGFQSLEWEGNAIDLNNDGIASTNLIEEYMLFSSCHSSMELNQSCKVREIEEVNHRYYLSITFPLQRITQDRLDNSFQLDKSGTIEAHLICFYLDKKGNLHTEKETDKMVSEIPESEKYTANHAQCGGTEILHIKDGVIEFTTDCRLYDYSSGGFVTGKIRGTFIRIASYN